MSLTEEIKQWYIKTFPGMNNKAEDLDKQDKWVDEAYNCRFETEPGAVDKREAVSHYNTTSIGEGAVVGLKRFYSSSGAIKFVCVHGTKAYVGTDSTGTWTEIRSDLTDGKRMAFEVYRDLLICSNGYDNIFVYDGSSDNVTWEIGACKAVTNTASTAGITATSISYKISYDNDAYIPGTVSNTIASVTAKSILLSNIPLGPIGCANRKIFRKDSGTGGAYKLVDTIADNVTTTYEDDTVSGSLGADMGVTTDEMPKGNILKVYRERLFISGDLLNQSRIYFSNPYLPHYIQQTTQLDYMEISPEDGDEIMGIPVQLGMMVCIKKNTIRKLQITTPTSGADPNTWFSGDPISFKGAASKWSITETSYGIIFLGWDHWYLFNGSSVEPIIDDFDVEEILPGILNDVVCFFHRDIFLAAYSDRTISAQYHNRIMRYNLKRQKLSIDFWTSSNIRGANCFAARTGDGETGDLFYGDSFAGYVLKDQDTDDEYKLRTKTECDSGDKDDVFVGGTENAPYIEIGEYQAPSAIPNDICIFWDMDGEGPGSGWTEITDYAEKFIKFSSTFGTVVTTSTHTHAITGTTSTVTPPIQNAGDGSSPAASRGAHSHTISGTNTAASDSLPNYTDLRIFKKNATTTEYEFPNGAIIMWDQNFAPIGWNIYDFSGYYPRLGETYLGLKMDSSHNHTVSLNTNYGGVTHANPGSASTVNARYLHRHTIETTASPATGLEYNNVQFLFIKKYGEAETWDGLEHYCYALFASAADLTNDWEAVTTYNDRYLKIGSSLTTQDATTTHTHSQSTGTTSAAIDKRGDGTGYHTQADLASHTHSYTIDYAAATHVIPSVTFRLAKKILGQMKTYNKSITDDSLTSGTWTSPSMQINVQTFRSIYWNEEIVGTDTVLLHTRTGIDQATCEAAAWSDGLSDANGSTIASTPNIWFQYKLEFTATDTTVSNPRVYFINGFVVGMLYSRGITLAEDSVNFKYKIGFRNFDTPMEDKLFKKLSLWLDTFSGYATVNWETEYSSGIFTITVADLKGRRWDTFFQDSAYGREVSIEIIKNDLYELRLKELQGLYSPQQVIL